MVAVNGQRAALIDLLNTLGIDPTGDPLDNVNELMNVVHQCLGGIRLLMLTMEKQRRTSMLSALDADESNLWQDKSWQYWALKKSFRDSVLTVLNVIMSEEELHDLEPSRHIVDSFPDSRSIGT